MSQTEKNASHFKTLFCPECSNCFTSLRMWITIQSNPWNSQEPRPQLEGSAYISKRPSLDDCCINLNMYQEGWDIAKHDGPDWGVEASVPAHCDVGLKVSVKNFRFRESSSKMLLTSGTNSWHLILNCKQTILKGCGF